MAEQQYQGKDTDIIIELVQEGLWTVEWITQEIKDASPNDTEWLTSLNEALTILQSKRQPS